MNVYTVGVMNVYGSDTRSSSSKGCGSGCGYGYDGKKSTKSRSVDRHEVEQIPRNCLCGTDPSFRHMKQMTKKQQG